MNRYKEARLRAGLSQKAAAISLGVKPPSMSDWENGKALPTHDHLVAMATLYGTTTDYLTGASDTKEKQPAVNNSELKTKTLNRLSALPDSVLLKILDLLEAIQEYRAPGSGSATDSDPSGQSNPE